MWKESYRIGIDRIDEQHMQLFQTADTLLSAINKGEGTEKFIEVITFLKNYVVFHFQDEEAYQESIHYAGIEEHKKQHRVFTQAVLEYEKRLMESDFDIRVVKDLAGMLTAWLIYHIADADQKLAGKEHGKAAASGVSCISSFSDSLLDVLEKMAGLPVVEIRTEPKKTARPDGDIFVEIGLIGDKEGRAVFGFSKEMAFRLIESMTFFLPQEIDELVCSALAELANIASGNAVTALSQKGLVCDIRPPVVSLKEEHTGWQDSVRIETGIGGMEVAVSLA